MISHLTCCTGWWDDDPPYTHTHTHTHKPTRVFGCVKPFKKLGGFDFMSLVETTRRQTVARTENNSEKRDKLVPVTTKNLLYTLCLLSVSAFSHGHQWLNKGNKTTEGHTFEMCFCISLHLSDDQQWST